MKKQIAIIAVFIAFFSLNAAAQQVWTLEQCVNHALTNNLQVKQQMLLVESAKADLLQSKLDLLPGATANATHGYNYGKTVDRYTNQFATSRVQTNNFYIQAGVTLFNGLQKLNGIKENQLSLLASQQDADKMMNDMSINIATYYLQVLFYKELVRIRSNQLDITSQQVDRMKKLVSAGTMAPGDAYTIEAQYAVEESSLIEAESNLEISLLTLSQMLDLPTAAGFDIEVPALTIEGEPSLVANPDQIFTYAQEHMPEIKAAEYRLLVSEKQLARSKGAYYPSLSLNGSWGTGYSGASQIPDAAIAGEPYLIGYAINPDATTYYDVYANSLEYTYKTKAWNDQINDNNNQSVGLNLTIPILNGWQTRTMVSKAKISLDNSKLDYELQKMQLRKTIQQAWADARGALKQYYAAEKKVNATRESFRYAEQKFEVGILNTVDYNNSKKDLSNAESELLQTKFDYIFKTTVLDFYMGKPLSLTK
jgi:outer membrane protein